MQFQSNSPLMQNELIRIKRQLLNRVDSVFDVFAMIEKILLGVIKITLIFK